MLGGYLFAAMLTLSSLGKGTNANYQIKGK